MPSGENPAERDRLLKLLDSLYDYAVEGIPRLGQKSATEMADAYKLADDYRKPPRQEPLSPDEAARRLVRWQVLKAGTTGFVTGLGGLITMPIGVPANLVGVLFLQVRMIAAIAHLGGHDTGRDDVRTLCYACLCGKAATDILKSTGIEIGKKLATTAIKAIPGHTLIGINKAVGFRLLTKFGEKGIVNIHKFIPVAGGIVGGGFDASTTYAIGKVARNVFLSPP